MDVHSVGKTETLEDIPLKYFVVINTAWEGDSIYGYDTKEEALTEYNRQEYPYSGVAIIRGYVIEGSLE